MHYLNEILVFITRHTGLAYGAIFLISLSESLALVGLFIPGTVIMFGIGAIIATGSLKLKFVLLLAAAGAIAGDGASYWLGHHYQEELKRIWPFSRYPGMLHKGEAFFNRHGGKSVLFGRFVGPVRPIIPVVAGMLGMRPLHFGIVNVSSAIGWALVYILPGVIFGTSLAMAGAVSTRLAVVVFILVAGVWGFIWGCRGAMALVERKVPAWLFALRQWSTTETPTHRFARPVQRFFIFLLFRGQGEAWLVAFLVLTLFVAGWGFLGVLQDSLAKDPLVLADQAVYHFFQSLRTAWGDNAFVAITEIGDTFVNLSLAGAILIVLLASRSYRTAGFWVLTVIGGFLGVQLLKWAIHLPRPLAIYHGASSYGFPSGHTTMSVILYGFIAILLAMRISGTWRWGMFSVVVLASFVIGFSRLYLGAHWLSGVLGGYFIGTAWTAFMGIAWLKGADDRIPRRLLASTVVLVIIIAGGWHVARRHEKDLVFYAPRHVEKTITLSSWQAAGWRDLPSWRIDMEGELEQPLTVQWAGSPDDLNRFLMSKGWRRPLSLSMKSFLGMFSTNTPLENLPVLPRHHDGRTERLRLLRMDQGRRLVFRMWAGDVKIEESNFPVFVGIIEEQRTRGLVDLIFMARDTGDYERPLVQLEQTLGEEFAARQVLRADHEILIDREHRQSHWQGRVLLVWENAVSSLN